MNQHTQITDKSGLKGIQQDSFSRPLADKEERNEKRPARSRVS